MHYHKIMKSKLALDPAILREVEASCVCLHVQRASRAVGRHYDNAFRHLGINNWQFSLLTALGADGAPSVTELAGFLGMDRTTMTRNLHVLEQRGLLAMQPDARDGRIKRAALTPDGRALLLTALTCWREANETMEARIPPASLPVVWKALEGIARS